MDEPTQLPLQTPPEPPTGLRIIEFIAENIKRIEVVAIRPDGEIVEITGKNGAGKTSVLDAMFWTFAGAREIAEEPIRRGADEGYCQIDLGEFIVRRNISKSDAGVTTSLSVRSPKGAEYRRPQEHVDRFFNKLSLDPLLFLRMDAKEKFALVRQFVPEVDFDAIELEQQADIATRRDLNAQVRQLKGVVAKFVVADEHDLPEQPVDIDALQEELTDAGKHNVRIETRRSRREALQKDVYQTESKITELDEQIAKLIAEIAKCEETKRTVQGQIDAAIKVLAEAPPLPDEIDTAQIVARLNQARGINTKIDIVRQRKEAEAEARRLEAEAKALTTQMAERQREADAKIAAASLPVSGLTLTTDGGVRLNDLPFDQASDAEQLRTSIALAMALNPRLKVIRVRDGSLLDSDGMELVRQMAKERGYQVWIESVSHGEPTGFELVAGRVRSTPTTRRKVATEA
jgi:energy-coupling factor transporter ATP-binding protein EcfA2